MPPVLEKDVVTERSDGGVDPKSGSVKEPEKSIPA
jgi:hypothetical protein